MERSGVRREKAVAAVAIDNKLHRVNGTEELELVLGEAATAHQAFDLFHFLYAAFFHAAAIILVTGSREDGKRDWMGMQKGCGVWRLHQHLLTPVKSKYCFPSVLAGK